MESLRQKIGQQAIETCVGGWRKGLAAQRWYRRRPATYWFVLICLILGGGIVVLSGCGDSPSQQETLQRIIRDTSTSVSEKVEQLARKMFDVKDFVALGGAKGPTIEMSINGSDPSVIVQAAAGKNPEKLKPAVKLFHLKSLINQLASFVHHTRIYKVQEISLTLHSPVLQGGELSAEPQESYRLKLTSDKFDEFEAAAKLRPEAAIQRCEKIWQVLVDELK